MFEYGLVWIETEEDKKREFLFVHPTSHGENFERSTFKSDLDVYKEFNWIDDCEWDTFYNSNGISKNLWDKLPLPMKISDLVNQYGVENIFGTTYWEGFSISKD